jgi:DNA-binding NarL/FixJ family response regulator
VTSADEDEGPDLSARNRNVDRSDIVRVLLADDHEMVRAGVRALLAQERGIAVIAEAADGLQAIQAALVEQPDVVLMDLHMPGADGIEATRQIVQASPHIKVLVLTMMEDNDSVFAALRAGALGYLLKGAGRDELTRAIQAVNAGEAIYSPAIAQRIIGYFSRSQTRFNDSVFPELTDREHEVLNLIAAGHNNAVIARRLVISPKTVRNHISNIFSKLRVADRAQAIVAAREKGYGGATEASPGPA